LTKYDKINIIYSIASFQAKKGIASGLGLVWNSIGILYYKGLMVDVGCAA